MDRGRRSRLLVGQQENVRLRSHLLEHIKLYFMYNKKNEAPEGLHGEDRNGGGGIITHLRRISRKKEGT